MSIENIKKNIPETLKEKNRWVLWKLEKRDDKFTKVPYQNNGYKASSTNQKTWISFDEAIEAYKNTKNNFSGIGFVFTKEDEILGVDLDKCRNKETGQTEEWAQKIIEDLNSYTELSPSETGYHIFIKANLPPGGNRKSKVEMYEHGRYFTMTGFHVEGTPKSIEPRQEQIQKAHAEHIIKKEDKNKDAPLSETLIQTSTPNLTDEDIIQKCKSAKNAAKFERLWNGNITGYPSNSEADSALASILAFYTQESAQIERIMRQSGLARKKWQRKDYLPDRVIENALNITTERYSQKTKEQLSRLDKDVYGMVFTINSKTPVKDKEGNIVSFKDNWTELADMDECKHLITKETYTNGKEYAKQRFHLKNKDGAYLIEYNNFVQIKNALHHFQIKNSRTKITRWHIRQFHDSLSKIPTQELNLCEVYGYYNGKYIDSTNYALFSTAQKMVGLSVEKNQAMIKPTDDYTEFIKFEPDQDKVKEIIRIINKELPRNGEKEYIKIILAWGLASIIKFELQQQGVSLFPFLVLIGGADRGKSTRLKILVSDLYKSDRLEATSLEGVKGSRLGHINKDTFPLFFDEVTEFDRIASELKNSSYTGTLEFTKGTKDGGSKKQKIYKSPAVSCNYFEVKDPAVEERGTFLNYSIIPKEKNLDITTIRYLEKNAHHLGRWIYSKIADFDYASIVSKLKKEYDTYTGRPLDIILFYKTAEQVLDKLGILSDVQIQTNLLFKKDVENKSDVRSILQEIIWKMLNDYSFRFSPTGQSSDMTTYTIQRILDNPEMSLGEELFYELERKGIFIKREGDGIVIGTKAFPHINEQLKRWDVKEKVKTVTQLGRLLKMENRVKIEGGHKIKKIAGKHSSKAGLLFEKGSLPQMFEAEIQQELV